MVSAGDFGMEENKPQRSASQATAMEAMNALGRGFDVTMDTRLAYCKGSRLVKLDEENCADIVVPGVVIPNVSKDIKCDKGERVHFRSEVLPFHQMSERFNQELSITGKMPLGHFNHMYSFSGVWQTDAAATKALALDGWFITLYKLQIMKMTLSLKEEVKKAVPSFYDPAALASFIEKYGTHVIVSVNLGGKDVVYLKQLQSSPLIAGEVLKYLKNAAHQRFVVEGTGQNILDRQSNDKSPDPFGTTDPARQLQMSHMYTQSSLTPKQGTEIIFKRIGGDYLAKHHNDWLATISSSPDVISMSYIPITSLLSGVPGSGFLCHAINLYIRYKPSIEELQFFLEFQIPRQWSPAHDLPLGPQRKRPVCPAMQFSLMGPKLYVSTTQVIVGRKPVTGLRLFLEGKRCDRLAIHLQHLSYLPKILQTHWGQHMSIGPSVWKEPEEQDSKWFEPVQWKNFSHVNTAPVERVTEPYEIETNVHIVTGAQLQVWDSGVKKILYLRLMFSMVPGCTIKRSIWDFTPQASQKSGLFSQRALTTSLTSAQKPKPEPIVLNSAVFPGGPPVPMQIPKLLKYVDIKEMTKGAEDMPGYWLVTGAKLDVDKGKIALRVKYSLLHY